MAQQYGTVKVDFITFTSGTTGNETDITIPVSGLADIAESGINISGDISARNITATGDLSVSGETLTSGLIVQNGATISGDLGVSGEVTASSVTVTGTLNASGAVNVSGLLTTSGLSVSGDAGVNALTVTGLAAVGTLTTTGSATVNGPATLNSGLTVGGATSTFNDTVTIASGLTVTNGGIVVSNAGGLNVDGDVIFQDNLNVSGTASFDNINASGTTTLNELTVTGAMTFATGLFASGTEAAPSISFVGDTDTGFYNAAANEIRITTSGNDRLTVDDTGNVGIGTTSPVSALHVNQDVTTGNKQSRITLENTDQRTLISSFYDLGVAQYSVIEATNSSENAFNNLILNPRGGNVGIGTTSPISKLQVEDDSGTANISIVTGSTTDSSALEFGDPDDRNRGLIKYDHSDDSLSFRTSGSGEDMRIDSSGRLLVGTTSSITSSVSQQSLLQVYSTSSSSSSVQIGNYTDGVNPAGLHFDKSRGSLGINTVLQNNDNIGSIKFNGANGTNLVRAASIDCAVDGIPGNAGDIVVIPGRLVFSTTASAATSPTPRMTIKSDGKVGIGTTSPSELIDVRGNSNPQIKVSETNNSTSAGLYIENQGQRNWQIWADRPSDQFRIGNNSRAATNFAITSTGYVGIGTTSPGSKLQVEDNSVTGFTYLLDLYAQNASQNPIMRFISRNAANTNTTSVDLYKTYQGGFTIGNNDTAASNYTSFYVGASERVRIDSSGRLLVGPSTHTDNSLVQVEGEAGDSNAEGGVALRRGLENASISSGNGLGVINFGGQSGGVGAQIRAVGDAQWGTDDYPGRLVFSTTADGASSPTERMRIDSSGNIIMGPGAGSGIISSLYTLQAVGTRGAVIKSTGGGGNPTITVWNNENTNDCTLIEFRTNTVDQTKGSVTYNASTGLIQYNTSSDYRAKTLNGTLQNASDSVALLSVYEGTMNGATQPMPMMVAHEVQEVAPYCVTGEKDAIDENGEPVYQQLNYSAIVPLLTAALQEALAKIESLESRLAALENS
jgi:hypothetical protein